MLVLTVILVALFPTAVSAAQLPLLGTYGSAAVCDALRAGIDPGSLPVGDHAPPVLVDRTHIDGFEWACDFTNVSPDSAGDGFVVTASCASESGQSVERFQITENSDSGQLDVMAPDGNTLTLFLCRQ